MDITQSFYDNMATQYDKLFLNWQATTHEQAVILERIFAEKGFDRAVSVLDCACGIGTQAIGLAALGYDVTASDISEGELCEARERAKKNNVSIPFERADFCALSDSFDEKFDIVIVMDNALPHMLTGAALKKAVDSITGQIRPGGIFVASIRDYDALLMTRPPYSPPYIHKTDEERVENLPWVLGYERPLIVTEKLDGTSSTYILERKGKNKYEFYVLSRNVRQADENQACYHDHNIYWDMAFKYNIEAKLREYMEKYPLLTYVCVQGESVGSVQGNPLKLTEDDFYVFNFIDSLNGRWASTAAREIVEEMGMQFVPILDNEFMMPTDMEEFKQMATAPSVVNPNVMREGIVLRDPTNDFSFKNVSREYLMKHNG